MCPFALAALGRCLGEMPEIGETVPVHLRVQAPESWLGSIKESLVLRLEAIPKLMLVEEESEAALTVWVDVGRVAPHGKATVGYSLAALIYSLSTQKLLDGLARQLGPNGEASWLRGGGEGNVRLVGMVHAQGARDEIANAYDRVVAALREKGLSLYAEQKQPENLTPVLIRKSG